MRLKRSLQTSFALLLLWSTSALAHVGGNAYLRIDGQAGAAWSATLELPLVDLDRVLTLDANNDQHITWGELKAKHPAIKQGILAGLHIKSGVTDCTLSIQAAMVDQREDLAYSVWPISSDCSVSNTLHINYQLFNGIDANHRLHIIVNHPKGISHTVIKPADSPVTIDAGNATWLDTLIEFTWEGIWHIWIGLDHILFLFALLVVAVYRDKQAVTDTRWAVINTLKIVTAFTIAHSITLILASFEIVSLPSRLVETGIALSIIVVAVYTLWTMSAEHRWGFAFAFGLLHGFGFAGVLGELSLPQADFAIALLAFNVGVELGQLALVAIFMPIAIMLRHTVFYRYVIVMGGLVCISILAAIWAWERYAGIAA